MYRKINLGKFTVAYIFVVNAYIYLPTETQFPDRLT